MPLTKSEFDRWKAQADEADAHLNDRPTVPEVATITLDGKLLVLRVCMTITETRALYEMLRVWYGEEIVSDVAKEVITTAEEYRDWLMQNPKNPCSSLQRQIVATVDAYRAEQKQ